MPRQMQITLLMSVDVAISNDLNYSLRATHTSTKL